MFIIKILFNSTCLAQPAREVDAKLVNFDDVFVLQDTVRFDPAVIIGRIDDMDISDSGTMLILDNSARTIYHFSATGQLLHELSVMECHPGANFVPWNARFIDDEQIIAWDAKSAAYLFDTDGHCTDYVRSEELVNIQAMCAHENVIYAKPLAFSEMMEVKLFSRRLELKEKVPIEINKWPNLTRILWIKEGRSLECFDDGVRYAYVYSADAIPVIHQENAIAYKPPFLLTRKRDKPTLNPHDMRGLFDSSDVIGLYRLNATTRMIAHRRLRHRGDVLHGIGLTIVDHNNSYPGISTVFSGSFMGAGRGLLYTQGDHELLPDGDIGNPLILRYRFVPPTIDD
ncbi:MAG: hypothetical protein OXE92_02625 [Bacteroidetes bacterium]|nr:hypothetical protein [Bacteroidota bacterium]MCY4204603.1 hypothetical protein [Bacteroidota bacterium]